MSADKERLVTIRKNLHTDIAEIVENTEHTELCVLRKPNEIRRQPASKIIVVVDSDCKAEELKKRCLKKISDANDDLESEFEEIPTNYGEIRYKIKVVHATGDIMVTVKSAQRRQTLIGEHIKDKLREIRNDLLNCDSETADSFEKCFKLINSEKDYVFAETTGSSYRLTFFNGENRQQESVGNIFIVVSDRNINIVNTPPRKTRADKKEWLYKIQISTNYAICIYEV